MMIKTGMILFTAGILTISTWCAVASAVPAHKNMANNKHKAEYHDESSHPKGHSQHGKHGMDYGNMRSTAYGKHNHIKHILRYAEELKLSGDQVKKLKLIKVNAKKEKIRLKADKEILKIDLKSELHSEEPNRNKANKLIEQIGNISIKLKKIKVNSMLDGLDVLDKEQLEDLKSRIMKKKMMMRTH